MMDSLVAGAGVVLSLGKVLDHDALMLSSTTRNIHHRCEPTCEDWPILG